ncbi:hypothetical protein L915_12496 [Phytophthora nicotianae]|uniref:Uncharacterized protein n=1 Tax=Phytophthora nicotianae TaxID=4792 RepID=W2GG93_PHYNI|nr:hypothetical protein L915_12496 [Phytophthora nicotianae]
MAPQYADSVQKHTTCAFTTPSVMRPRNARCNALGYFRAGACSQSTSCRQQSLTRMRSPPIAT